MSLATTQGLDARGQLTGTLWAQALTAAAAAAAADSTAGDTTAGDTPAEADDEEAKKATEEEEKVAKAARCAWDGTLKGVVGDRLEVDYQDLGTCYCTPSPRRLLWPCVCKLGRAAWRAWGVLPGRPKARWQARRRESRAPHLVTSHACRTLQASISRPRSRRSRRPRASRNSTSSTHCTRLTCVGSARASATREYSTTRTQSPVIGCCRATLGSSDSSSQDLLRLLIASPRARSLPLSLSPP